MIATVLLSLAVAHASVPLYDFPLPEQRSTALDRLVANLAGELIPSDVSPAPSDTYGIVVMGGEGHPESLRELLVARLHRALPRAGLLARPTEGGAPSLMIEVSITRSQATLTVSGVLRRTPNTLWGLLIEPEGEILAEGVGTTGLDEELLSVYGEGSVPSRWGTGGLTWVTLPHMPGGVSGEPIVALQQVGIATPSGAQLIAVGPREVYILEVKFASKTLSIVERISLSPLPPSDRRARRPWGDVVALEPSGGDPVLVVSTSDRARTGVFARSTHGWELRWSLPRQRPMYALGPSTWLGAAVQGSAAFEGAELATFSAETGQQRVMKEAEMMMASTFGRGSPWLSLDAGWFGPPSPERQTPWWVATRTTGEALVVDAQPSTSPESTPAFTSHGVAGFVDLNGDHEPELMTTVKGEGRAEALHVYSLGSEGPILRIDLALSGRITSFAPVRGVLGDSPRVVVAVFTGSRSMLGWVTLGGAP